MQQGGISKKRTASLTYMEAESTEALVVGQVEDRGGTTPERLAAICISLVLL